MSTEVNGNWQVDEMNSALNDEFDAGFNGIGMEISNTFNMKFVSFFRFIVFVSQ